MSQDPNNTVEWDGKALIGWITINGALVRVRADREMIHRKASGFNDALGWEIERHRVEIFEKLKPFLLRMDEEAQRRQPRDHAD